MADKIGELKGGGEGRACDSCRFRFSLFRGQLSIK